MRIVIVGASRGIGLEVATHLARHGHQVLCLSRTGPKNEGGEELTEWVNIALPMTGQICDATNRNELKAVRNQIECLGNWTHVDALICCAAQLGPIEKALSSTDAKWILSVADNLAATLLPIQVFQRLLRLADDPKVICFSGGGATKARPMFSSYACAKTAIVRLVETIAAEEPWLDINAVAPGAIQTDMTDDALMRGAGVISADEIESAHQAGYYRADRLETLFHLIDWLLSPKSSGISGRLIAAQFDTWSREDGKDDWGFLRRVESRRAT